MVSGFAQLGYATNGMPMGFTITNYRKEGTVSAVHRDRFSMKRQGLGGPIQHG